MNEALTNSIHYQHYYKVKINWPLALAIVGSIALAGKCFTDISIAVLNSDKKITLVPEVKALQIVPVHS